MNLATLVSSLVLAASTATAGLLAAPSSPLSVPELAAPAGGPGPELGIEGPGFCLGACDDANETYPAENETADDNQTAPPEAPQETDPEPEPAEEAASAETCGVDLHDSRNFHGDSKFAWSWDVGTGTRNLTVELDAQGLWSPSGGGASIVLRDGNGRVVASSSTSGGSSLPFDYTAILYEGSDATGLARGTWTATVEADGYLGGVWLYVRSTC